MTENNNLRPETSDSRPQTDTQHGLPANASSKAFKKILRIALVLGLVSSVSSLIMAATANWPFTVSTEVSLSDSIRIEVAGGKLQLKLQKPWWRHDSKTEFDAGTYSDAEYLDTTNLPAAGTAMQLSSSGLVSYWPFNGTTGAIANNATAGLTDSKTTNNGTAVNTNGTGMAFATGRFANGVNFDGVDDVITMGSSASLSPSGDMTASAWVKPAVGSAGMIMSNNTGCGNYNYRLAIGVNVASGKLNLFYSGTNINGNTTMTTGTWNHVAMTRSGSSGNWIIKLYVNGVQDAVVATSVNPPGGTHTFKLGQDAGCGGGTFSGVMDDIAVWNRALTKDEIEALASAGAAIHMKLTASITKHAPKLSAGYPGLVAYWPFDESTGTTSTADLASKNKGTLGNIVNGDHGTGINGKGLDFGTNKTVTIADNKDLSITGKFTLSFWMKPNGTGTSVIIDKRDSGGQNGYSITHTAGHILLRTLDGSAETALTGSFTTSAGTWYHVAAVYDGTNSKIYIDGTLDESAANTRTPTDGNGSFIIGSKFDATSYYSGMLDEVAVFNRALSAGEIAYLAGKKGETATYTSPVMDGEITTATWDKLAANFVKMTPGMQFMVAGSSSSGGGEVIFNPSDLDGDGDLDFITNIGNGEWWENDGAGFFTTNTFSSLAATKTAVGDLTGDKALDIVEADNAGGGVKWWKNSGAADPTFTEQTSNEISTDASPQTVALGDIDNDGDLDVVAGFGGAVDKIVWYQSDGASTPTFTAQTAVATSWDAYQLVVTDINADGFLDIAAASSADNRLTWFKGDGGSSWTTTNISASFNGAKMIAVGDVDSDGDKDIAAVANPTDKISWFANDGSATPAFSSETSVSTGNFDAYAIVIVDFDNDGATDLLTAGSNGGVTFWQNNGSQVFTNSALGIWTNSLGIGIADFNGDGAFDIVASRGTGGSGHYIHLNTPWKQNIYDMGTNVASSDLVFTDMDDDGFVDAVLRAGTVGFRWLKNSGTATWSAGGTIDAGNSWKFSIQTADFDNDGDKDIVAYNDTGDGTYTLGKYTNNGGGTSWSSHTAITTAFTINSSYNANIVHGDFDNDGDIDFALGQEYSPSALYWYQNDGSGSFTENQIGGTVYASTLVAGDIDNDGDLDLITRGRQSEGFDAVTKFANNGSGSFTATGLTGLAANGWHGSSLALGDLDKDGDLDIIHAAPTFGWRANDGTGSFGSSSTIHAVDTNPGSLRVLDLNADGHMDIAGIYYVNNSHIETRAYLNDGAQNFSKIIVARAATSANFSGANFADLNHDGLMDFGAVQYNDDFYYWLQQPYAKAQLQARTDTTTSPSANFTGPDGTLATFLGAGPSAISGLEVGIAPGLDAKRYFQWRGTLYRNDTTLDPMIKNVRLDYTAKNYSTLNPYAVSATATKFTYLTQFGTNGVSEPAGSDIRWQLSGDGGATWYYYNSGWVTSDGTFAQSSDSGAFNTNISTFDNALNLTADGFLKVKAIMSSNGDVQPSLDQQFVDYELASISLVKPNGGDRFGRNTSQLIEWTNSGNVPNDLTLEYNSSGSTTVFDQSIDTTVSSNTHNEEKMTGAVAVYHFVNPFGAIASGATAGLTDSKGSFHGTASNANTTGMAFAAGKFDGGVDFDGVDDYITVTGTNTSQVMSVSVWINPTVTNNGMIYSTANPGDFLRLQSGNVAGAGWAGQGQLNGVATISASTWTHLALVRTGSTGNWTVSLYVNGVFDSSATSAADPGTGSAVIGRRQSGGTGEFFTGKIDELAFFNRALSADEIAALAKTNPGYVWKVPNIVSTTMRARVRSTSAPAIRATSAANFKTGIVWTNGGGNNLWSNAANWDAGVVPQAGDAVIFNSTSTANCTGDTILDNLGSIVLDSTYTGTVTIKKNSVAGGMTLNVNNDVTVNGGFLVLEADRDGTPTNGSGFTINAKDITVGASGNMNADTQGFAETQGPGYSASTGSSHGGVGASSNVKATPAPAAYGAAASPISIGSGGWASGGGAGGGAIKLSSSGTITINGTVSANAAAGSSHRGTGSGGSIWITGGGTLAGTGTISANGGVYAGTGGRGGGGGRMDISGMSSVTFSGTLHVLGGDNTISYDGYAGTIVFPSNYNLTLATDASGLKSFALGFDGTYDYSFNNIVVKNGATLTLDGNPVVINSKNGGASGNPYGSGAKISAASVDVQSGGKISADSAGFRAASNSVGGVAGNNGGSYGGAGSGTAPAAVYGKALEPRALGSAVNDGDYNAASGGGAIYLAVTGTTTVAGTISANGGNSLHSDSGSGGSIWISTGTLTGNGTISADGASGLGSGRAGGGGRVYITAGTSSGFSGTTTAAKGTDANENNAANGTVIVGKVWKAASAGNWSSAANWTNGSLPGNGDSVVFSGLISNQNATLDAVNVSLANFIVASDYTGTITLNQNAFSGTDTLTLTGDLIQYNGNMVLNSDVDGNPVNGEGINITAANILIDTPASLNANGKGFAAGGGPGHGGTGQGATHGGVGGFNAAVPYGSATAPIYPGSGGGSQDNAGGGAIGLTATGTLTVNGNLSALGQGTSQAGGSTWEGGSGGSLNIAAGTLTGTGSILANGGSVGTSGRGAGAGGRISLVNVTTNTFSGILQAKGGDGTNGTTRRAHAGTIAFPSGFNLTLGGAGNMSSLRLGSDGSYNQTFGTITINSGGTLEIDGNPQMNSGNGGALSITATGVTVALGGVLSADALGFGYTAGPGFNATDGIGASYGGKGGLNSIEGYGYAVQPSYLGSSTDYYNGGGALRLFVPAGTVSVGGRISADGGSNNDWESASGGSVYIVANTLSGGGIIRANAGNSPNSGRASGSGGRVYLALGTNSWGGNALTAAGAAAGGTGNGGNGANGTVTLASLNITSPNGAEVWRVNSSHLISWTTGTTLPNDLILDYSLNDPSFVSPISINTGVAGNHHNEEKMSGAVAVYHFDQGQPIPNPIPDAATNGFQDSKGTFHGTTSNTNGTGLAFTAGKFGNGVDFDGTDDYVSLAGLSSPTGVATVAAWVKADSVSGSRSIIANASGGTSGLFALRIVNSKVVAFWDNVTVATGSTTLSTGTWYHLAMVRSGSSGNWTANVYVNGVLDGTGTTSSNPSTSGTLSAIGRHGNASSGYFDGVIDEAAVYDRVLTADELAALASSNPGYVWTVPDLDDATVRLRVRSAADTVISDISTANFTVADINMTSPNGSEVWTVGSYQPIKWLADPSSPNDLTLDYSILGTDFTGATSIKTGLKSNTHNLDDAPSIVSVWHFDGTTGAIANNATAGLIDSKGVNEGTARNADGNTMAFVAGKYGNGVQLDGVDSYIDLGGMNGASSIFGGNATFSFWINWTTLNNNKAIIRRNTGGGTDFSIGIDNANKLFCDFNDVAPNPYYTTFTPTPGTWYHIACTYDQTQTCVYINGSKTCQAGVGAPFTTMSNTFAIGGYSGVSVNAVIDEFAVFNRALSDAEVSALAQSVNGTLLWQVPDVNDDTIRIRVKSAGDASFTDMSDANFTITGGSNNTRTWDNGSGDDKWSNPVNWSNNLLPVRGNDVVFNSTSNTVSTVDYIPDYLNSISLNSGYTNTVTFNNNVTPVGGSILVVNLTGNLTVNSGNIAFNGNTSLDSIPGGSNDGTGYTINAANVTIANGSKIHADGKGFPLAAGPGGGQSSGTNNGGSYGGVGTNFYQGTYGSFSQPTSLGSGGGSGAGGGAIKLNVSGTTTINGTLSASGDAGYRSGSGGSLWIITNAFAGASTGLVQADGGPGSGFGAGGGGRVKITWTSSTYAGKYSVAGANDNGAGYGEQGTLSIPWSDITNLTVDKAFTIAPNGTYTFGNWTVTGAGTTLGIMGNSTLTFGDLSVASSGAIKAYGDGATDSFVGNDPIRGVDVMDGTGVTINATNLTVNNGTTISSIGFDRAAGPGAASSAGANEGASYGGRDDQLLHQAYGSLTQPTSLGSGGGGSLAKGGGALKFNISGTTTINGTVHSDGPNSSDRSGAAGSIWLITDNLAGAATGVIRTNASNGGFGAGGGGRISLNWNTAFTYAGTMASEGGANGASLAEPGTIAYLEMQSPNGAEVWKANKIHGIHWYGGRDVPADVTLEYGTAGSDFSSATSIATNLNATHHNEEKISGAVGVWHFGAKTSGSIANGATASLTDSKNTNHGTASNANGTGMAFASGKFGGAVDFDGTDDLITLSGLVIPSGPFTISVWANPDALSADGTILRASTGNGYALTLSSSSIQFRASGGTRTTIPTGGTATGQWHHLVLVRDAADNMKGYKNGVALGAATEGNTNSGTFTITGFGSRTGGLEWFDGKIDEVAVFDRALSAEEIAVLANTNPGYVWTAPALDLNTVRVRARSVSQPNLTDTSNANFTITDLNVTAPNGAEVWNVGTTNHAVTWSAGAQVPNDLILEYTTASTDPTSTGTDPLTSWVAIDNTDSAPKNASPATHTWLSIPDAVSASARVRVRSQSSTDLVDVSNANFTIADLDITNHNGAGILYEGEKYQVTWAHGGTSLTDLVLEADTGGGFGALNPPATSLSVRRADNSTSSTAGFNPAVISNAAGVWRFNEGSGTGVLNSVTSTSNTFSVGSAGNTTVANAWVDGKFNKALDLDGTDDTVIISDTAALSALSNLTVSAWFKTDTLPGSGNSHRVVTKSGEWALEINNPGSGTTYLSFNLNGNNNGFTGLSTGTWYHAAVTFNGSTKRIYLNGVLNQSPISNAFTVPDTTNAVAIASDVNSGSGFFNGLIDEVAVYSRALSDSEIRKLAGGSYEWTVPDTPSTTSKVRVRSASATDMIDPSDADFEIRARAVTVNVPNGGESYQEASRQIIQWTTEGLVSNNLTLDYNKNGGAYTTIATGVDAGGKPFERAVGAWGFGEGTGQTLADKSGKGNNGTLGANSSAGIDDPIFVLGKFGHGLSLDGVDDEVIVPNNTSLDLAAGSNLTISAWIKPSSLSGLRGIAIQGLGGTYFNYNFGLNGNQLFFGNTSGSTTPSTGTVSLNTWTHVAVTKNGTSITYYIDGASAGTGTRDNDGTNVSYPFRIGGKEGGGGNFYMGLIDEVQVYNRALSSSEITALASGRGNYSWTVPNDEHTQVRVRVTDANRAASNDASNADFAITPRTVAVNAPNGAEQWPYNSIQYIKWDATGPLSNNLTIKYDSDSTGGPVFPTTIATGVDAGGSPLSGSVGAWGLGEGTGTALDDKAGTNDGTLNLGTAGNTVTADAWKVGKLGYGIQFDGIDDSITLASNLALGTGDFSISLWMKTASSSEQEFFSPSSGSATQFRVTSAGRLGSKVDNVVLNGTVNIADNNWHHVVMTADRDGLARIYVDGTPDGTVDISSTASTNLTGAYKIGVEGAALHAMNGMLDEYQIYNRILTPAEITVLAQGRGIYPWTVSDPGLTTSARAFSNSQTQVFDANRTATTDNSDANFTVRSPIIGSITPPPPAAVPFGAPQDISWANNWTGTPVVENQGGPVSTDLRVEYSIDDGSTFPGGSQTIIGSSAANGGPVTAPYNWGVTSGAVSNTVKIRVRDNVFPFGEGISSTFKVTGSVTVIKPNTAEKWAVGFPHTVSWLRNGDITNVKIYTHNGDGTPITTIVNSTGASAGSYVWTPALGDAGTGLYIRVQDAADNDVYDDSNVAFSVSKVQVVNPASRLLAGDPITTTWSSTGVANVKLEYSTNGTDFSTVSGASSLPAANLSHNWTVPLASTTNFIVRATDADVPGVGDTDLAFDASDSNAVIYGGLQVLVPSTTGITWASGQPQNITWSTTPANANVVPNVRILAAKDGNFNNTAGGNIVTIVSSAPNHNNPGAGTGLYVWVPNFTSTLVKIRVLDPADPAAVAGTVPGGQNVDDSNNFFTISGISLTSPAGGETALVNGAFGITFGFTGVVTNVDLHYSTNGGSTWTPIISTFNVPTNPYTYNWTPVPNAISTNVKVRVRDSANPSTVFAESPAFNIKGSISVTTPPTLYVGDPYTIQYTTTGSIPDVKIEFSPSGNFGGDEITIASPTGLSGAQTPTSQTFNWTVPNNIGTAGKIRVTADNLNNTGLYPNGSPATSGTSGAFSIGAKLTVTAPTGSDQWGVNDSNRLVTWTSTGTVSDVKIEYLDESDSYVAVKSIINSTSNDGSHAWNPIPDIVSNAGQDPQVDRDIMVKVRITDIDPNHPAVYVESAPFKVKWYRVLWKVKDADSGAFLQNLSVIDSQPWTVNDFTLTQTSGVFRNYKKGNYTTTWQKSSGYGDATIDNWVPDDANPDSGTGADMVREAFLQNDATANVPKQVRVEYDYDTATKTISFRWWIEIKGKLETAANLLGAGRIEIINPADNAILQTINDAGEDVNGLYDGSWIAGNAIDTTVLYFAKAIVTHNSQEFTSGITIDLRDTAALQNIGTDVTALIGQVGTVQTTADAIDTKIGTTADDGLDNSLFGKVASVKETVGSVTDAAGANTIFGKIAESTSKVSTILDEVQNKIPSKIDQIDKEAANKGGRGQLLKRETKFAIGQTASIRFQHDIGKAPVVDVYGPDNTLVVTGQVMTDASGKGIYNYDLKLLTSYKKGDYTVIVTEPSSGFMDSMVLTVLQGGSSDEDLASSITSASSFAQNASQDAKKAYDEMLKLTESMGGTEDGSMGAKLGEIQAAMAQMKTSLFTLTGDSGSGGEVVTVAEVHDSVLNVMKEIKEMVSKKGINLDAVYKTVESQGETTTEIQNMVTAVQTISQATQEMIEKAQDKPVMTTWFEG